ncbi:hypothetical protein [Roseovarius sp. SCSIO 43702]|nr:hypothetical protein [Roseovarius sp. SCSIO 43702]
MADEKQTEKKPTEKKADDKKKPGMTPERAKELGLDPFPYGGN